MKKAAWIIGIICLFIMNSCREDVNITDVTIITPEPEVNVIASMRGVVVDENDTPVPSALVSIGTSSTFTNNKGEYSFIDIIANQGKEQITINKTGYFTKAAKIHNQSDAASYNNVALLAKTQSIIANTNDGVASQIHGGASIVLSSNSLRQADGSTYEGEVRIYSRFLNPEDENFSKSIMSELVGLNAESNKTALRPLAMLHLDITSIDGETLEINEDVGIEFEFPVPENIQGLGSVPSWMYDLEEEFWLQNVDCYPASGGNYGCTIYGTGAWTCCMPVEGIEISLDVINSDLTPASFVKVEFEDNNSYFHFGSYTNSYGQVQGMIPINQDGFILRVEDLCANIVHEDLNAGPYSVNTQLPDIILDALVEEFSINVQGNLLDCSGLAVSDGWLNVRYPDYEKNFAVNPDGSFNFDVYFNCINFPDMEIEAYDMNGEQASTPIPHNYLSNIETGIISSCEALTSSLEIEVDGNVTKMFPVLYDTVWSEPTDIYIQSELPGSSFYARINNYNNIGNYMAEVIITNDNAALPDLSNAEGEGQTLNVEITSDNGMFLIGNIQGTLNSSGIDIDATFIARKKL